MSKSGMLFGKKFDFIFSLGENCAAATYLRRFNLRYISSPFDWLCNVSLKTRVDLLVNGFNGFLEKQNLCRIEKNRNGDPHHDFYLDKKLGFKFLHDFPVGKSLDDSFPAVKEKYNRRIERLLQRLKTPQNVLCVWSGYDFPIVYKELQNAISCLSESFPEVNFSLLVIENDMTSSRIKEKQIGDDIIVFTGPFIPDKTLFEGDKTMLNLVYSQINHAWLLLFYKLMFVIYRRVKRSDYVVRYLFGIPIFKRRRK
jgi:hypothetical protein